MEHVEHEERKRFRRSVSIGPAAWFAATLLAIASAVSPVTTNADVNLPVLQMYQNPLTQLSISQATDAIEYNRLDYSVISSQPIARWFVDWNPQGIRSQVASYVGEAAALGQVPVMVIYNIYKRDCVSASAGGAQPSDDPRSNGNEDTALFNYRTYIANFAAGIKDGLASSTNPDLPVIVLLEPDSLALQSYATLTEVDGSGTTIRSTTQKGDAGCADFSAQYNNPNANPLPAAYPVVFSNKKRTTSLKWAVSRLASAACYDATATCGASHLSRVKVYLDGAHSNWGSWPSVADGWLVQGLIDAGIQKAAGIFTNASNYQILGDPASTDQHNGELAYGRWLLDKVKAKLGGSWGDNIPEKHQVIDVARSGAGVNLSSSNDQGNGWPGWCDSIQAAVGQHPTLYPQAITGADWVDALLWIKPAGETDGCFGNGKTNHAVGRGVPNPDSPSTERAGTFDYSDSCMLLNGISGLNAEGNPILNNCWPINDWTVAPPKPTGLRIASFTSTANGDAADAILLEWEPSGGACQYQVGSRVGTTAGMSAAIAISGTSSNGAATSIVITPDNVNAGRWRQGSTVQFAVRARACGASSWSAYSKVVTTHDFP